MPGQHIGDERMGAKREGVNGRIKFHAQIWSAGRNESETTHTTKNKTQKSGKKVMHPKSADIRLSADTK